MDCGYLNEVVVLKEGYSYEDKDGCFKADCTISLIKHGDGCIIVDTGLPCDKDFLVKHILLNNIKPEDVGTVVATHGHSDHVGNLNLFSPDCLLVVGHDISKGDVYINHGLKEGKEFFLTDSISVLSTPGHTCSDVSVLVKNTKLGTIGIAGDVFECESDILNGDLWRRNSSNPDVQIKSRMTLTSICDYIVPGHGPMFRVNDEMKMLMMKKKTQIDDSLSGCR